MIALLALAVVVSPASSILIADSIVREPSLDPNGQEALCQCLNWNEVYTKRGVVCGQAWELQGKAYSISELTEAWTNSVLRRDDPKLQELAEKAGKEWCGDFFPNLKSNAAVNMKLGIDLSEKGAFYDQTWCYIDSRCVSRNGGTFVPDTSVAWKFAKTGKGESDAVLRDMNPEAVEALARKSGVDFGLLSAAMGYTVSIDTSIEGMEKEAIESAAAVGRTVGFMPPDHQDRLFVHGHKYWRSPEMPGESSKMQVAHDAPSSSHQVLYDPAVSWHLTPFTPP